MDWVVWQAGHRTHKYQLTEAIAASIVGEKSMGIRRA
jgi:hypothetical protein